MKLLTALATLILLSGCAINARDAYRHSAVADGMTTIVAVNQPGIVEGNPLGAAGTIAAKVVLDRYAESLPEEERKPIYKTATAVFTGAAFNNTLTLFGAVTPVAVGAGVLLGLIVYFGGEEE